MVEYRDIIATDEVFEVLTNEQMQVVTLLKIKERVL